MSLSSSEGYGAKRVLHNMERKVFNALVILLAAAISTGIGFLIDQVGYMLRGGLLMKGLNTKQEIAYIWQGTLGSYALLVWSHLRRKSYNVATTLALLFLIANVVGRLSVALFGFTYALDFTDQIDVPALQVVQWPEAGEPMSGARDIHSKNVSDAMLLEILRTAATGTSTSLILPKENNTRSKDLIIDLHKMLNIPDLLLSIAGQGLDSTVSYTYQLKDEGGDQLKKENRTIKTISKCTQLNNSTDLSEFPSTFYPIKAVAGLLRVTTYTTMSFYTRKKTSLFHTVATNKASSNGIQTDNHAATTPVTITGAAEGDVLKSSDFPADNTMQVDEGEDHNADTVTNGISTEKDVTTKLVTVTRTDETGIVQETTTENDVIPIPVIVTRTTTLVTELQSPFDTFTSTEESTVLVSTKVPTDNDVIPTPVSTEVDISTTPVAVTSTDEWPTPQYTNLPTVWRRDLEGENADGSTYDGTAPLLEGWMMFPYPRNTVDCGAACTNLALSTGNATYGVSTFNEYGVRYQCQIMVNYEAIAPWTKSDRVAPSEALRGTLSGFLVGNKTRRDMFKPDRQYFTYLQDRLWLPSREKGTLEEPIPTVMIAGALARAVALVVRRMGDGLERVEIMPPKTSVVAILSVQWQRVVFILAGIAGFQLLVAVLAGWFVRAKLEVEYDVDLEEGEYGCPWQVVQMYKETPIYRFAGVIKKNK
ncbi:hypothetical protein BDZ91DRAFT_839228 [Kalaharituber pfeilii]|nr:hypothetical protein BDZ91DRAFT_839228 [Kalaharituber pfeilii]